MRSDPSIPRLTGEAGSASVDPPPLVRLDAVSKTYREGGVKRPVLRDVTVEFARGGITSLTGASGSGKSTLIALIAGLTVPDSGRVVFEGRDLTELDDAARAELRGGRIGIVLQSGNLIPFLTALQNVELARELGGHPGDGGSTRERRSADHLLAELGVDDRRHHLPRRMSGGEAQRVSVAVALANEPDLLLADEVTGQLDSVNAEEVMRVILEVSRRRELTVLFVTHNPDLAARAERRLVVADGGVHER